MRLPKLTTKDVAMTILFTALYAVFTTIPIFQVLGAWGSITAAAITAPIIGMLLGPYVGSLSAALGGSIGFFSGSFAPWSFFAGIASTLSAGLLFAGKRSWNVLLYLLLLLAMGFYPDKGSAWLFPLSMWFQIIGFLIIISPLTAYAVKSVKSGNVASFLLACFVISLSSTLAGRMTGSIVYMMWIEVPLGGWLALWQTLTIVYPIERTIIAVASGLVGAALLRVLAHANLMPLVNRKRREEKSP